MWVQTTYIYPSLERLTLHYNAVGYMIWKILDYLIFKHLQRSYPV